METALSRAKTLNKEARNLRKEAELKLPQSERELQASVRFFEGEVEYLRRIQVKIESAVKVAEVQLSVNRTLLQRKQGRAECGVCHIVREGKEVDGAFICSICSGPSPLRRANK